MTNDRVRRTGFRAIWLDCVLLSAIVAGSGIWGDISWHRAVAREQPFFYQTYFEPAVMIACGKGFVIAQPQIPAMTAFLDQKVDRFSCDDIPPHAVLGTRGLYQGAWRYLMVTVGWAWRILGISWSGMGPLFGLLFAMTVGTAYAIFRLGMGPWLAALGSAGLSVSHLTLTYLPILRDFAKAPFTLLLVLLLGLLVTRRPGWKTTLTLSALYGLVLGVGYGFRTDFLANIPPFFVVLVLLLEGGLLANLRLKAAAGLLCAALFAATAWPVISSVQTSGGCQWHTVLLGFPTGFSRPLGLAEPPYKLLRAYSDDFVYTTVAGYVSRTRPQPEPLGYCRPDYDAASGRYLSELARRFPADMTVRAYGSALRVIELPFSWNRALPGNFEGQLPEEAGSRGYGLVLVVAAILLAAVSSVRAGLFLLFFVLYFGGYPAAQFQTRHYFHLEFITWWAALFVLHSVIRRVLPLVIVWRWDPALAASVRRATAMVAGSAALLAMALWGARLYQQAKTRVLFESYLAAARDEIPLNDAGVVRDTRPGAADFLQVDVNGWRCDEDPTVTFRYDKATRPAFSRRFVVPRNETVQEATHIFTPVYAGFHGIELSDTKPGCVAGVYRVRDPATIPVMLEVTLPPRWRRMALYQQFGKVGSPELDAVR